MDYYKPKLGDKPKPLDINNKDYNVNLFSALNHKNGLIDVELEKEVVISRIAKDLYSSWKSAIRELLNNEYTSCLKAKDLGLNPKIYFTLDPINRILEIEGINSLGISSKVFLNIMRYIGRSGNFEGDKVGQFGFGFKSYLMLSENIIVETYSYESKEKYAVMGKKGLSFDILPKPDKDQYGTKLTLTIRPEITFWELRNAIFDYAQYKDDIAIYVNVKHEIEGKYSTNISKGIYPVEPKTLNNLLSGITKVGDKYKRFSYQDNDIEILFDILGDIGAYNKTEILLIKTPIEGYIKIINGVHAVINIKNERLYKPTADRDRLTDKALEDLGLKVNQVIKLTLETYINGLDTYDKWLTKWQNRLLFKWINHIEIEPKVWIIADNLQKHLECYGEYLKTVGKGYSKTTKWVIGRHDLSVYELLHTQKKNTDTTFYLCDKFSYAHMKPLTYENKIFVKVYTKDMIGLLSQYEFKIFVKTKLQKKKPIKVNVEDKTFIGHYNKTDYRQKYVRNNKDIDVSNTWDNVLMVNKGISNYYELFNSLQTNYVMIKANKGEIKALADYPNFELLEDAINTDKVYKTTRYPITLKDLLEIEDEIKISDFHYFDVAHNHKDYIVIGDNNELFLLACVLLQKGKQIKVVDFNTEYHKRSTYHTRYGNYAFNDNYNAHVINMIQNMLYVLHYKYADYYDIMSSMYRRGCDLRIIEKLFNLLRGKNK